MEIVVKRKRKVFGKDFQFDDFISVLKNEKVLLNFDNPDIMESLKKDCFDFYCAEEGRIYTYVIKKDVIKRLPNIKHSHLTNKGLKERGFDDEYISAVHKKSSILCVEHWTSKGYSVEEAKEKISKLQSERGKKVKGKSTIVNKAYIRKLYGEDYVDDFFKKRSRVSILYWTSRGYTEEEAKEKIKEIQSRNYKKRQEDEKRNPLKYQKCNCKNVLYWTSRGYTEEDAIKIISESQKTFTLEKCILIYGEEDGYKRWKERQIKWQESMDKRGFHQLGYSKISQNLFHDIEKIYPVEDRDYLFFETKNKEYTLKKSNGFYYRFDFCDLKRRKFIEFNGDIYHANPKLYEENEKPNPYHNMTSKELWEADKEKMAVAEANGFKELVVWEKEYRDNKEETLNKCINFLLNDE